MGFWPIMWIIFAIFALLFFLLLILCDADLTLMWYNLFCPKKGSLTKVLIAIEVFYLCLNYMFLYFLCMPCRVLANEIWLR